ncbi:MAG: hypothetical protein JKY88_12870 [Pseudomonadales bacterium]|nr:hypothetical protein [Pseudomonadales bacterium]
MLEFPLDRRSAILKSFPDSGLAWLDTYSERLEACLDRWQLSITGSVTNGLPINMIYFVETSSGEARVLKIGHPHPEQKTEILALRYFNGKYSVPLLDVYRDAILLDRIFPGSTFRAEYLKTNHQLPAPSLFADLPQPIKNKESKLFPSYSSWMTKAFLEYRRLSRESDSMSRYLLEAESLYREIDDGNTFLLHGDLHHENILRNIRGGWTAIDPKGVVGPKIMECGRYIHNFMEDILEKEVPEAELKDLIKIMEKRINRMSEVLSYECRDLAKVAFVDITLSTCWTINAGENASSGLQRVKACYELLDLF